jgi:calcium-dependent protein kinase
MYQEVGEEQVEDKPSNKAFLPFKNAYKRVKDINKYFLFERELGRGAFGEVWLAIH